MRCVSLLMLAAALLLKPAAAWAQTPPTTATITGSPSSLWYAGINTGPTHVDGIGGLLAGELGIRTWRNLEVGVEGGWLSDTATSERKAAGALISGYLQATQGRTTVAKVKTPTLFLTINGRWVFGNERRLRPYIVGGIGGARVKINSEFTLDGVDVSDSLAQYGVTLGGDLTGRSSHAAITIGAGLLVPYSRWYVDAGYRLTTITGDGSVNVNRLNIGLGVRF